jgi:hypothetical protein
MKVVRLSALRTGRLYPQEIFPVLISVRGLVRPQGHSAAGRIMSMKNSTDTIWDRMRDLPTYSAVPQSIATPRTLYVWVIWKIYRDKERTWQENGENYTLKSFMPVLVAKRSKAWVCGRSPVDIVGSNPSGGLDVCVLCLLCVVRSRCVTSRSLVQRSPTNCGASLRVI